MLDIFLVTARTGAMPTFIQALSSDQDVRLKQINSGAETLAAVQAAAPHLVIIDSELPDTGPLGLVQQLLMINAMVNTAVISPISEEEFHEQSEGLGIMQNLPMTPDAGDAANLLQKLRQILSL